MENQLIYCAFYNLDCIYDYHFIWNVRAWVIYGGINRIDKQGMEKDCFLKSCLFVKKNNRFSIESIYNSELTV